MGAKLTEVVIDSADPPRLARFWSEVLGWPCSATDEDGSVELAEPGGAKPTLLFVPVPEPKVGKNRIHLDVNPTGCDQEEELGRLFSLGARPADVGQGEQTWVVLADPEGNEFCLLRSQVD
jgi:catechol 2,3-dioxygenase-like lactoylglutathione lyase family enzyme